jgi:hypothetical protein
MRRLLAAKRRVGSKVAARAQHPPMPVISDVAIEVANE